MKYPDARLLILSKAPDAGTARREAVIQYTEATVAFQDQLDVVRSLTP